jgi:hypothetical protein
MDTAKFPFFVNSIQNIFHLSRPEWNGLLPFPHKEIFMPFYTRMYFLEDYDGVVYLRHCFNRFFVRPFEVAPRKKIISISTEEVDENTGVYIMKDVELIFWPLEIGNYVFTAAYRFNGEEKWFLPRIRSNTKFEQLDAAMQSFYKSVNIESSKFVTFCHQAGSFSLNEEQRDAQEIAIASLMP